MPDILPRKNEEYGTKEYWDQRYTQESEETSFDWFKSYGDIADIIRELIPDKSSRVLMLGCGNSTLSQDMYDDGYKNIVNADYSGILIDKMKRKHAGLAPEMEWHEMDIRDLKFDADSFDVAIDKGTMDAMMTAKADVWDPPEEVVQNCNREVDEPHFRRRYLDRPGTTLEIRKLGEAFHYHLYIVRT
ncbi:S-adenosyl-L-methionine-dependent methyltransferase [Ganoderma leucocontextum]|nr:S-adenosyl-L-methionine-dependent methyltransferase [Ganoderma leucocontextum]